MAATPQIVPISASPVTTGGGGVSPPRSSAPKPQEHKIGAAFVKVPPRFTNLSELIVPMAVLGIVLAMIAPLPAFVLDILISANITVSVIVLLVSMYIIKPVEFNV